MVEISKNIPAGSIAVPDVQCDHRVFPLFGGALARAIFRCADPR